MTDVEIKDYGDSIKKRAELLIIKRFPEKLIKLNTLLEISNYQRRDLLDIQQDLNIPVPETSSNSKFKRPRNAPSESTYKIIEGTKVHAFPKGSVPCNKIVCDLIQIVKPHIKELINDSNLLKMWISFLIPKIEDGNNFGVSIQKSILAEIETAQAAGEPLLDEIAGYLFLRGKLVSKVAKYPYIDDYRRAVQELDEKEYLSLWHVMCGIRDHYCSLHDVIIKNFEKIKIPRSSNSDSLY